MHADLWIPLAAAYPNPIGRQPTVDPDRATDPLQMDMTAISARAARHDAARADFPHARPARNLTAMDDIASAQADPGDDALMLAYAAGDTAAFETLYCRHRDRLYRFLVRQLRSPALADELFQDVWQRVIAARGDWRPDALFTTWLYRIAHNRLVDHWRSASHRPPAPEDAEARTARIVDPDTPERHATAFDDRRRLHAALDALPVEQREVVLLRLEHELTLEEIGAITGAGRETVKSRLRYAMDKLRAMLNA